MQTRFKPSVTVAAVIAEDFDGVQEFPLGEEEITCLRFACCNELGAQMAVQAPAEGIARNAWLTANEVRASTAHHSSPQLLKCVEDFLAEQRFPLPLVTTGKSALTA